MSKPRKAQSKPAPLVGLSRLAAGGTLVQRVARRVSASRRWLLGIALAAAALVVLWVLFTVVVGLVTNDMWFDSVHAGSVYTTTLGARIGLFAVFGAIAGLVGGLTLFAIRRMRPKLALSSDLDTFRWTFRRYEPRVGKLLVLVAFLVPAILVGRQAAAGWQTYLLWANSVPTHQFDPQFHHDTSFYLEIYPFHLLVLNLLLRAVTIGLWTAVIAGYWYGVWRIRRGHRKITREMTRLVTVLLGLYVVGKAYGYWISRYGLTTSTRGPVTGSSYTDLTAALPSRYVLVVIAALAAVVLLVNAFVVSRVRVFVGAVAVGVLASLLVGTAWPSVFFHFEEAPSAARVDLKEIARNQQATRDAFDLGNVTDVSDNPSKGLGTSALVDLAGKTSQISLIDPNKLSPTFNVLQQIQSYYGFKNTLDIGHYPLNGISQDVALAVRELQLSGVPVKSWVNTHLVYTHGYGVVAAPTTEVDSTGERPVFLDAGIPPQQQIPVTRPQVYFGQFFGSSTYSIVGRPAGSTRNIEFDHPAAGNSSRSAFTTYQGHGGIPIGSAWRRLLFAVQLHAPNIFFSNEINSASQLLEVRNPRARVAKIAPWLTLDGNVYPAVVDGKIKWIVDGYTTSSTYPNSQLVNLHSATNTTLVSNGATVAQPSTNINYMRNSVKAVVDAYTGKVTLYSWNQQADPDPLLSTWEKAFPGLVKPQSSIPSALLSQLRYPTDQFNVQRSLLAKYHVTSPSGFYSGNDFWTVPSDPTYKGSASQPSRYMSMSTDGYGSQRYALSSPMVTLNGRELAAFISVDAQPGADYGKFVVVHFPSDAAGESPSQVQNDIESDTRISEALTLQRGGHSKVVLGDLEAIPLAGRILYVEPVYTQSKGGGTSFPVLRHVIALYGDGNPSFADGLQSALQAAIKSGLSGT